MLYLTVMMFLQSVDPLGCKTKKLLTVCERVTLLAIVASMATILGPEKH